MSKLWKYFKSLFQEAEQSSAQQPLIHELIERSEEEKADYEQWKKMLVCRRLCDWLNDQYVSYLVNPDHLDEAIDFLETPSAKGFIIYFRNTQYSRRDCVFLFDYLKEKVLRLQYRTYVSDTRTFTNKEWVENLQRHYLKPRINMQIKSQAQETSLLPQYFGNITIELMSRDEQVWNLKFSAVSYRDRKYQEVHEFKDLMHALLKE